MKKVISSLLAFVMVATMLPFGAFAAVKYDINCTNCFASYDGSTPITGANQGETVHLTPQIPAGKYVTCFTAVEDDVNIIGSQFTMPAHAVNVSVRTEDKTDKVFDLRTCSCSCDEGTFWSILDAIDCTEVPPSNVYLDGAIDLDGDGLADIEFSSSQSKMYATEHIVNKNTKVIKKTTRNDPFYPYKSLSFRFKEDTRTVTWKTYDGKVLRTEKIPVTQTVSDKGLKTTRPSDGVYKYTFKKWGKSTDKAGNVTFTPQFTRKAIPIKLTAPSTKTYKAKQKTKKLTVTLKIDNKYAKRKKLTLTFKGKKYSAMTNSKGKAVFKITKLVKKGAYTATVKYVGKPKNISKKIKIKVK